MLSALPWAAEQVLSHHDHQFGHDVVIQVVGVKVGPEWDQTVSEGEGEGPKEQGFENETKE